MLLNRVKYQSLIEIISLLILYVLKSDSSQTANNFPDEEQPSAIFELDEDGNPILAGITYQSAQFPGMTYWIEDIKSRFEYYSVDEEGIETLLEFSF